MSRNPDALVRFWKEFSAAEPDALLGGIYANKRGYHNARENLPASDYSVKLPLDKQGPKDKASAIDLTFKTAQRGDFRIISKYTKRLITAMEKRDKRLFYNGEPVIRECFGNADNDREVEGYTFSRTTTGKPGPATSDPSHLWHLHISFHRKYCNNWSAVRGVLDVLLNRQVKDATAPKEEDPLAGITLNDIRNVVREEINAHDKKKIGAYDSGVDILFGSAGAHKYAHLAMRAARQNAELLAEIAKLAAGGLTDEDRKALAAEIAARVDRLRVEITRVEGEEA